MSLNSEKRNRKKTATDYGLLNTKFSNTGNITNIITVSCQRGDQPSPGYSPLSAVPTMDKQKHSITSLFLSPVNENVTNYDNDRKAYHHSTTNLSRVNNDKEHTELQQPLGRPVL